ncbi:MAG: hypothetical protein HOP19_07540 [Acidobacteria bacterium]|nr:hypothetical protein [Acidobacteriota bacterium]
MAKQKPEAERHYLSLSPGDPIHFNNTKDVRLSVGQIVSEPECADGIVQDDYVCLGAVSFHGSSHYRLTLPSGECAIYRITETKLVMLDYFYDLDLDIEPKPKRKRTTPRKNATA